MIEAIRSQRKFTIALLILFLSFGGLVAGKVDSGDYMLIVVGVMGLYGYANVQDKRVQQG